MPESKSRKKKARPSDPAFVERMAQASEKEKAGNPPWLVPTMLTLMVGGLVWIVTFYLTSGRPGGGFPVPVLHNWNLAVGFVLIITGFGLTTRWK